MSSKAPVVQTFSWKNTIPQFVVLSILVALSILIWWDSLNLSSVGIGAFVFLMYSFGSRWILLGSHRKGMQFVQEKRHVEAISQFEESYNFFSKHLWIDRYRSLVAMSPSSLSFREMALNNIAFCYGQLGSKEKLISSYERILREFPENEMAKAALQLVRTIEDKPA